MNDYKQVAEWSNKILEMLKKDGLRSVAMLDIFQTLLANAICSARTKEIAVRVLTEFSQEVLNMIAEEYKDEAKELK